MSDINDFQFFVRAERQAREQAEASTSNSITARIAHLARAEEYARKAPLLSANPKMTDSTHLREHLVQLITEALRVADLCEHNLIALSLSHSLEIAQQHADSDPAR